MEANRRSSRAPNPAPWPFCIADQPAEDLFDLFNPANQWDQPLLDLGRPLPGDRSPTPGLLAGVEPVANIGHLGYIADVADAQPDRDIPVPGPPAGEPVVNDHPVAVAEIHPGNPSPEVLCNGKCKGDLLGPHKCKRLQRRLHITCLSKGNGGNDCAHPFNAKHEFNRHCKTKHGISQKLLNCTVPGCEKVGNKGFTRKDNLLQHLRKVHNEGPAMNPVRFKSKGAPA